MTVNRDAFDWLTFRSFVWIVNVVTRLSVGRASSCSAVAIASVWGAVTLSIGRPPTLIPCLFENTVLSRHEILLSFLSRRDIGMVKMATIGSVITLLNCVKCNVCMNFLIEKCACFLGSRVRRIRPRNTHDEMTRFDLWGLRWWNLI